MPEESATPDLNELFRQNIEAVNRGDLDAYLSSYAPDAAFQTGVGRFEGRPAIRDYLEDLWGSYDELVFALEELHDLGNGVAFLAWQRRVVFVARARRSTCDTRWWSRTWTVPWLA